MKDYEKLFTDKSNTYLYKDTVLTPAFLAKKINESWKTDSNKKPIFLDLGCSNGYFLNAVSKYCSKVIGYERHKPYKKLLESSKIECPHEIYFEDVFEANQSFKTRTIKSIMDSDIIFCYAGNVMFRSVKKILKNCNSKKNIVIFAAKAHEYELLYKTLSQEPHHMKNLYIYPFIEEEWVFCEKKYNSYGKIMDSSFLRSGIKVDTKQELWEVIELFKNCDKSNSAAMEKMKNFYKFKIFKNWPKDWPAKPLKAGKIKLMVMGVWEW
jgi:hypothetical protein